MITAKNVEQFDYIPYTLPSLDMLIVANKKEAIKILDEANRYLADTIGHYSRFYNEAVAWKEKNKASIRDEDLKDIDENLKNLLTNIVIVAGATVKITNATSDLSGKTQRTDIKSTTGNGKDNERDRTISQISATEVGGIPVSVIRGVQGVHASIPIDKEAVDKALEGINVAIDGIVVKVPTPTIPADVTRAPMTQEEKDNIDKRTDLNNGISIIKEQEKAIKTLVEAIKENPTSVTISKPDDPVTSAVGGVKVSVVLRPTTETSAGVTISITITPEDVCARGYIPFSNPTTGIEAGAEVANTGWEKLKEATTMPESPGKIATIIDGVVSIGVGLKHIVNEAEKERKETQQEINQQEKARDEATEKAKQEAQQTAAVTDLNNIKTAIQQGTGSINTALDAINEAERKSLITPEDAEKQREAVVEKAATALGIDDAEKETMKTDIKKAAKELNDKIKDINKREKKGELTHEEAERERQRAQEESKQKTESFVKDSITTSGSWQNGTLTTNPDGTTTWTSTDSAGNTITTTLDKDGNGTVTTITTDGMTNNDTVTDGKKDGNTTHTPTKPVSGGGNNTTTGGSTTGGTSGGPSSTGSNTE